LGYDRFRYAKEAHIFRCPDNIDFKEKRVLELGLGQGADSEQIIRRGAIWSGLNLTQEAIDRVRARLSLRHLPHDALKKGSVLEIPFVDSSFDVVFSHGVLHHVPGIKQAQREICSVEAQLVSISLVRRLGLMLMGAQSNVLPRRGRQRARAVTAHFSDRGRSFQRDR
jgi:SAM-dependent methyltransferase